MIKRPSLAGSAAMAAGKHVQSQDSDISRLASLLLSIRSLHRLPCLLALLVPRSSVSSPTEGTCSLFSCNDNEAPVAPYKSPRKSGMQRRQDYKMMLGSGTDSTKDLWGRTFGPFK